MSFSQLLSYCCSK